MSRGSSVSIVSIYGMEDQGLIPAGFRHFIPTSAFRLLWLPPSLLSNGQSGEVGPRRDAEPPSSSRAEVKKE
jgi:hypothetical protein